MTTIPSLNAVASEIHATARRKGFWDGGRNTGEALMLIVSELAEALESHRAGQRPLHTVDGKPEGVAVELADVIIRTLDLMRGLGVDVDDSITWAATPHPWDGTNFGAALLQVTALVCSAADTATPGDPLAGAITATWGIMVALGVDPLPVIHAKMTYNTARPHLHGKAY